MSSKKGGLKTITFKQFMKKQLRKRPDLRKLFRNPELEVCLAFNLAELRIKKGLNQARLAKKSGVSKVEISKIEDCNFMKYSITIRVAEKLAKALGVSITNLLKPVNLNKTLSGI